MAKNQEEFLYIVRNNHTTEQITPIIAQQAQASVAKSKQPQSRQPYTALLLTYDRPGQGREILVLDIDPYSLLSLAHEIQQKIDPAKQSS